MNIDQVLDEYRMGNAEKRISLFLYHRELRDEFTCIDQVDAGVDQEVSRSSEPLRQSTVQKFLFMLRTRSCRFRTRESMDGAGQ